MSSLILTGEPVSRYSGAELLQSTLVRSAHPRFSNVVSWFHFFSSQWFMKDTISDGRTWASWTLTEKEHCFHRLVLGIFCHRLQKYPPLINVQGKLHNLHNTTDGSSCKSFRLASLSSKYFFFTVWYSFYFR